MELLQDISQLENINALLQDVVVVNNASTSSYEIVKHFISTAHHLPFIFIDAPSNLGVAQGRNFAANYAKGEILVFIDDDILIPNRKLLSAIVNGFRNTNTSGREIGVVAFKVLYHSTGEMQKTAFPHKNFKAYKDLSTFLTYYFVGCAHAMKRKVWNEAGNYPPDFFYGMEEYDLSFRVLDMGYAIQYDASVELRHKESPLGRRAKAERIKMFWVNKSKVAWKYLPGIYFCSTVLLWSGEYLIRTLFNMKHFIKGWNDIRGIRKTQTRTPVSQATLHYLKQVNARLWY